MNLSELKNGDKAIITKVRGRGAFRKRIMEMGFVRGKEIEVIKNAPLRDPIEYKLLDYNISLRRSEARHIIVAPLAEPVKRKNHKGFHVFRQGTGPSDQGSYSFQPAPPSEETHE